MSQTFQTTLLENSQFLKPAALKLTHSQTRAEDLVQETMYKALKNSEKFRKGTNLKSWLYTIMKNIFINNYRKNKKRNTIQDQTENMYFLNSIDIKATREVENNFLSEDIEKAFSRIPDEVVKPFMMYFSGYKYLEIAEIMDVPLGTVKSKIFFAKKEIRKQLATVGIKNSKTR